MAPQARICPLSEILINFLTYQVINISKSSFIFKPRVTIVNSKENKLVLLYFLSTLKEFILLVLSRLKNSGFYLAQ